MFKKIYSRELRDYVLNTNLPRNLLYVSTLDDFIMLFAGVIDDLAFMRIRGLKPLKVGGYHKDYDNIGEYYTTDPQLAEDFGFDEDERYLFDEETGEIVEIDDQD